MHPGNSNNRISMRDQGLNSMNNNSSSNSNFSAFSLNKKPSFSTIKPPIKQGYTAQVKNPSIQNQNNSQSGNFHNISNSSISNSSNISHIQTQLQTKPYEISKSNGRSNSVNTPSHPQIIQTTQNSSTSHRQSNKEEKSHSQISHNNMYHQPNKSNNRYQVSDIDDDSKSVKSSHSGNTSHRNTVTVDHDEGKKMFKRFYDKFSDKLDNYYHQHTDDKSNIDLIGNHRFSHLTVQDFLKEKDKTPVYNKFNPQFEKDLENLNFLNQVINKNENPELVKIYRDRKMEIMNKIELTPLPVVKKHLSKDEQSEVKKVERSAVIMRRYEYEMNLQKRKTQAQNRKKDGDLKILNKDNTLESLHQDREMRSLSKASLSVTSFKDNKEESQINQSQHSEHEERTQDKNFYEKLYFIYISNQVRLVQRLWRKFYHDKIIERLLLLGKIKTIQKNWKFYLLRKAEFEYEQMLENEGNYEEEHEEEEEYEDEESNNRQKDNQLIKNKDIHNLHDNPSKTLHREFEIQQVENFQEEGDKICQQDNLDDEIYQLGIDDIEEINESGYLTIPTFNQLEIENENFEIYKGKYIFHKSRYVLGRDSLTKLNKNSNPMFLSFGNIPKIPQKNSVSQFNQIGQINSINFTSFSDKKFSIQSYNRNSFISSSPSQNRSIIWDIFKIILIQKRFRKYLLKRRKIIFCKQRVILADPFFSTKIIYKKEDYLKFIKIQNMIKKWIMRIRDKKGFKCLLDRIVDLNKSKNKFELIKKYSLVQPNWTSVKCEDFCIFNSKPKKPHINEFDINKAVYLELKNNNDEKKKKLQLVNSGFFHILSEPHSKTVFIKFILRPITIFKKRKSMTDFLRLVFIQRIFKNKLRKIVAEKKIEEQNKNEIVHPRKKVIIKPIILTKKKVDMKDLYKLITLQKKFRKNILKLIKENRKLPSIILKRPILSPITLTKNFIGLRNLFKIIEIQRRFKNKLMKLKKERFERNNPYILSIKPALKPITLTKNFIGLRNLFKIIEIQRRFKNKLLKLKNQRTNEIDCSNLVLKKPKLKLIFFSKTVISHSNLFKIVTLQRVFKYKLRKLLKDRINNKNIIITKTGLELKRPMLKPLNLTKKMIDHKNIFKIVKIQRKFKNILFKILKERVNPKTIENIITDFDLKRPILKPITLTKKAINLSNLFKIIIIQRKYKNIIRRLKNIRCNKESIQKLKDSQNENILPNKRGSLKPIILTKKYIQIRNLLKIIKIQRKFKSNLLKKVKERSYRESIQKLTNDENNKPVRKRTIIQPVNLSKQIRSFTSLLKIIRLQKIIKNKFIKSLDSKKNRNKLLTDFPKYDIRPIIRIRLPYYAKISKKLTPILIISKLQKSVRNFLRNRKFTKFKKYSKFFHPLSLYLRKWVFKIFKSKSLLKFIVHMKHVCSKTDKVLEYLKSMSSLKKNFEIWHERMISKRAKENLRYLVSQVEEHENLTKLKELNNVYDIELPYLISKKLTFNDSKINYNKTKKLSFKFNSHELKLINVIQARGQEKEFYNFYLVPKMIKKINSNLCSIKKKFLDDLKFYARVNEHNKSQILVENLKIIDEKVKLNNVISRDIFNFSSKFNLEKEKSQIIKKLHFSLESKKNKIVNTLAAKNGFNCTTPQEFYTYYLGPNLNKIYIKNLVRLKNYVIESFKKRREIANLLEKINKRNNRKNKAYLLMRLKEISMNEKLSYLFNKMNIKVFIKSLSNILLNKYLKITHLCSKLNKIILTKNKERFMFNIFTYVMSKYTLENYKSSLIYSIIKESIKNDYLLKSIPIFSNENTEMKMKIYSSLNYNHENIFKFLNRYSAYIKGYEIEDLKREKNSRFEIKCITIPKIVTNNAKSQSGINSKANQIEMLKKLQSSTLRNHGFLVSRNETITLTDLEENIYKNSNLNTSNISII